MGARIRTIKPDFWRDEKVASLPREVRLTFLGLISAASDDVGRCRGNPRVVRAAVYPLDDDVSVDEITSHLKQLADVGLIKTYSVNAEPYIEIVNFTRHQRIDRPSLSQLPPPANQPNPPRNVSEDSSIYPGNIIEPSVSLRPVVECSGKEGSSENKKGAVNPRPRPKVSAPAKLAQDLPPFSMDLCNRLYEVWLSTGHSTDYARFRKALIPLFPSAGPRYEEAALTSAIVAFNEAADGASPDRSQYWHVNKFVEDIGRWVRLGAMPLIDVNGPTERGRAVVGAGP